MAFFFVPAGVSILEYVDLLRSSVVQMVVICTVSAVVTFAAAAYSVKLTLWLMGKRAAMREIFFSPFFGVALTVLAFWVGLKLQKKTGWAICSPLLIAIVLVCGVLLALDIPYEAYDQGGSLINLFLAPATSLAWRCRSTPSWTF